MTEKKFPRLENAPIIEALIDIQVRLDPQPTVEDLKSLIPESIRSSYPNCDERKVIEAGFGQSAKGKFQQNFTDHGTVGYLLRDKDNKKVLQVRLDGFGFSHLQPYSDFESFQNEAKSLWEQYTSFAPVAAITRVALLYINIIDFGKKISSLSDFGKALRTVPSEPLNVTTEALTFQSQFQLRKTPEDLAAVVTQHAVQNVQTGSSGIKFQIDASKLFYNSPSEEDLWKTVAQLRTFKNEIFFGSVDPEQIDKFKPLKEH